MLFIFVLFNYVFLNIEKLLCGLFDLYNMQIATSGKDFGWGALLQYHKKPNPQEPLSPNMLYILDVAISFSPESIKDIKNVSQLMPTRPGENGVVEVLYFL